MASWVWRSQVERAVRPLAVVVVGVDAKDVLEVASAEDQQPVQTLGTDGANEPFRDRVRLRRSHRCLDDPDAFAAEDLVEGCGVRKLGFACKSTGSPTGNPVNAPHRPTGLFLASCQIRGRPRRKGLPTGVSLRAHARAILRGCLFRVVPVGVRKLGLVCEFAGSPNKEPKFAHPQGVVVAPVVLAVRRVGCFG